MSDKDEITPAEEAPENQVKPVRFPELAELEENIRRRLRSNQRFLERFMDEDFNELDEDETDGDDPEDPDQIEEL